MFGLGPMELMIVLVIAVLLFGKRLPEVAKSLGKGVIEFKKGIRGIEDEVDRSQYSSSSPSRGRVEQYEDRDEPTAPKFEPPPAEHTAEHTAEQSTAAPAPSSPQATG